MIRVLRIINRFNLGGPTYNAAYLTRYLGDDFQTLLIGGRQDQTEANSEFIVKSLGIEPLTIKEMHRSINPVLDFQAYSKLKGIIREFRPHIVHTHASKAGALGRRAAFQLNVPIVVHTFHGHVFDSYFSKVQSNFYIRLERQLAKKTDAIVTLSENQFEDIVNRYKICNSSKARIIPLGFDLSRFWENSDLKRKQFREKYNLSDNEIAIGIIGRLVPVKNHALFIDAFRHVLNNTNIRTRAFIVGDGESRQDIEQQLKRYGIEFSDGLSRNTPVVFTSWEKDVDFVNAGLDIIALTSLNEGTPVSLIEAQAAGKPIITTNVGGIRNIVIEGKTAIVVNTGDDSRYISLFSQLVENEEMRKGLSGNGREFVEQRFHYSRLIHDMRELYSSLLAKKNLLF
jgi:glycosyltransferase involved in cell wall biosynthesis